MHPNIFIGDIAIPTWYAMLILGAVSATALAIYARPKDFMLGRPELLFVAIILIAAGLVGGRALFNILHGGRASGGFAYFGALILSIITLWAYTKLRKIRFLALADYALPFLMLSQVFVRIGCLMAGCCYGKATNLMCGVIFKTGDKLARHPTQVYEAILLLTIYVISRIIYGKKRTLAGHTFFTALMMYGAGRFFVEFLRTDSFVIFLNLTLAQYSCLALALAALIGRMSIKSTIPS